MPPIDSPAIIVARYLRSNGYEEVSRAFLDETHGLTSGQTLDAFLKESGLPPDAGSVSPGDLTLEQVLREKMMYDLTLNLEKASVDDGLKEWKDKPAQWKSTEISLTKPSNLLQVAVESIDLPGTPSAHPFILASSADRRLYVISTDFILPEQSTRFEVVRSFTGLQDSPILSFLVVARRYLVCTGMSGMTVLYDVKRGQILSTRQDHTKYVVKVVSWTRPDGQVWIATAGWDKKVNVYLCHLTSEGISMDEPFASIQLTSDPESLLFFEHPDDKDLYLLLSRRDSTFIYYYGLPESLVTLLDCRPATVPLTARQNLAPLANAWTAFTPSAMAICPHDSTLLAIATSSTPHMKLLIVRLLFPRAETPGVDPPPTTPSASTSMDANATPAVLQAREALAVQDRETAAIYVHSSTMAPQTPYSTPAVAWRPDGSGVWVNSEDGVVRGIEASSGRVVKTLEAHVPGSKVRCLWAGALGEGEKKREYIISGGFDHRLIASEPSVSST
ncbi:hypothetical protein EJ06DRAFT_61068 [Trichodelitschia bisporula]|uniref:LisH domain-containing protein n=1 Tax=Trichodelitschia bisporula TaxID=703511 RepID=A0A6G1HUU9_9PEZI|nr:hypothetical protein EJ06DRAFT_61068 [Trichodelitschia bisporula]